MKMPNRKLNYTSTQEILDDFEKLVPTTIRNKYAEMSFIDMADMPECSPYADKLIAMEYKWNILESATGETNT